MIQNTLNLYYIQSVRNVNYAVKVKNGIFNVQRKYYLVTFNLHLTLTFAAEKDVFLKLFFFLTIKVQTCVCTVT